MDEQQLLGLAKSGDLQAFNLLVLAYQNQAFSLAYRIIGEAAPAADAAQLAFISAFRHLADLRGGSFRAWLLRIVANASLDELRRRKRRGDVSLEALSEGEDGEDRAESLAVLADPADGPEEAAVRADLRRVLEDCLQRLTADQRATVLLADVHAMDYTEVSAALRIAMGTVKSRVARARSALRDCLKGKGELPLPQDRLKVEASS